MIADNTFAAFKGRNRLKIEWDNGGNASYNSAEFKKELQQTARQPGKVITTIGDPDAAFAKARSERRATRGGARPTARLSVAAAASSSSGPMRLGLRKGRSPGRDERADEIREQRRRSAGQPARRPQP